MLKPDMRMIWANSGDVVTPPESKIDLGWILEKPPSQYFNWHLNRTDRMLVHINRRGIPSWSSDTEYHTDGIASYVVGSNGRVYVSVAPSGNNTSPAKDPTTDTTREFWKPAFVGWDEAIPESQITGLTTKLNSKVDKTQKVNTSNGLSGGGDLSGDLTIRPTYGTTANTVTQGNDPRLSDSREWSAATVGEAEAKAGTATTRRAWTAQRVHQAADGWHDKKFSTIVKNILSRSNAQQIRNDLQLGTAATRDVGTSAGEVLVVGDAFGLGGSISNGVSGDPIAPTGFGYYSGVGFFINVRYTAHTAGFRISNRPYSNDFYLESSDSSNRETFSPRVSILHTGNILSSTGNSPLYPMTQAATTAALNQKVSNTTSIIAGTGLEGGGTLSQNRTLSVKYGTTAGTAVEGNDSRVVNALQKGNNLNDVPNKTLARQYLGLGSAATRDVGTGLGNVLENGEYGFGRSSRHNRLGEILGSGFYSWGTVDGEVDGIPDGMSVNGAMMLNLPWQYGDQHRVQLWAQHVSDRYYFRRKLSGILQSPVEILHTGNILSSTGTSSQYPMTQAAVTSALNTKADKSYVDTELGKKATVGTGSTQVRTNSQLDSRYVQGQAGTSGTQFRNNSQNDSRYIQGGSVVQTTGTSTTNVMSQKAVTDSLADVTDKMLGVGQSWINLTGGRSVGTTYTNTTGRPIQVITVFEGVGSPYTASFHVEGVIVSRINPGDGNYIGEMSVIVPNNHSYRAETGGPILVRWAELR